MQTTNRVLVYFVVILMCFILYKYGGRLIFDKAIDNNNNTGSQIESSSTSVLPSSTPETGMQSAKLSSQISPNLIDDILNDDHDNISLDISNINIDGISKENITESDDFARLESSLCGETL